MAGCRVEFEQQPYGFVVIFYRRNDDISRVNQTDVPKTSLKTTPKASPISMNETQKRILKMIKNNPKVTQKEIARELNLTVRAVKLSMKNMSEKGIIKRIGAPRSGEWEITEV